MITIKQDQVLSVASEVCRVYNQKWQIECVVLDAMGELVRCGDECHSDCVYCEKCTPLRRQSIDEAARWGEPFSQLCMEGNIIWTVPVMYNQKVIGGLMASVPETDWANRRLHEAALDMMAMCEQYNITNSSFLEMHRMSALRESERAEAIIEHKTSGFRSIREIYFAEEPSLISAIKQSDRKAAREILNRVLVGIYYVGRNRPAVLKSFLLELVVMMSRSAVEAGADPVELLGVNYSTFGDLASLEGEEAICRWLVQMLERIMDAIGTSQRYPVSVMLGAAVKWMQEHMQEDISRDDAAKIACLSPTHFSRALKQAFGRTFTEMLVKMRIDKAKEMLALTDKSLSDICFQSGFNDQSYFTKVFQKSTGATPGAFRKRRRTQKR